MLRKHGFEFLDYHFRCFSLHYVLGHEIGSFMQQLAVVEHEVSLRQSPDGFDHAFFLRTGDVFWLRDDGSNACILARTDGLGGKKFAEIQYGLLL